MPYIDEDRRDAVSQAFDSINPIEDLIEIGAGPGDLAFLIADAVDSMLLAIEALEGGYRYSHLADIDGVLGTAQHEFRRRILDPYEDLARSIKGEVYTVLVED